MLPVTTLSPLLTLYVLGLTREDTDEVDRPPPLYGVSEVPPSVFVALESVASCLCHFMLTYAHSDDSRVNRCSVDTRPPRLCKPGRLTGIALLCRQGCVCHHRPQASRPFGTVRSCTHAPQSTIPPALVKPRERTLMGGRVDGGATPLSLP